MQKIRSFITFFFMVWFGTTFHHLLAQSSGLQFEIESAVAAVNDASVIDEQLYIVHAHYHDEGAAYTTRSESYASDAYHMGGIVKITSGFVQQADLDGTTSANFTRELLSTTDLNKLAVEVEFGNSAILNPAVREKKVLFLALGIGSQPSLIDKASLEDSDSTDRAISDYVCYNPTASRNSNSTSTINAGVSLGTVRVGYAANETTNILLRVDNSFRKCYPR